MATGFKTVYSVKNRELFIIGAYKFRFHKYLKNKLERWSCCKKTCAAYIHLTSDNEVVKKVNDHNHDEEKGKLNRKTGSVCKDCKKSVVKNQIHTCPDLKSSDVELEQSLTPISTIKKTDEYHDSKLIDTNDDKNIDSDSVGLKKDSEFSKEDCLRLIELIEPCRPIWDRTMNLNERSLNIREQFWNQVVVQFEGKYNMSTIKKRWYYLKQTYIREKKIKPSGSEGKKKEWVYLKYLTFLDSMIENNKRKSCNLANDDTILSTDSDVREKKPKCTKVYLSKKSKQSEILNITNELLKEPVLPVGKDTKELNEGDTFFKYLSARMKGLPKKTIIKLQDEFLSAVRREHSNIF